MKRNLISQLLHGIAGFIFIGVSLAPSLPQAEENSLELDNDEQLEYIDIDEILLEIEPDEAQQKEASKEGEFVNIDELLYGTDGKKETKPAQQAEDIVVAV